MEIKTTCCFTGCRPERLSFKYEEQHPDCLHLKELLRQEIVRLITEERVTHFITGMALGADQICAGIVLELKETYPQVELECAIPYEEQAAKWKVPQRDRYFDIIVRSDTATQIQGTYTRDCMRKRNHYMGWCGPRRNRTDGSLCKKAGQGADHDSSGNIGNHQRIGNRTGA